MSTEFLITCIVVVLLPGTGVLYTLAVGLGRGFRPSIAAAAGCTAGIVPAALAGILGLAALMHTSAVAFQIVKYIGVLYLFYMAWTVLRQGGTMDVTARRDPDSLWRIGVRGALLNVLNPKLSLFFLAFLPQFVPADTAAPTVALVWLATVFMGLTFVCFVGYGALAASARDFVISRPAVMRWLRRAFAATFALLGLRLVTTP